MKGSTAEMGQRLPKLLLKGRELLLGMLILSFCPPYPQIISFRMRCVGVNALGILNVGAAGCAISATIYLRLSVADQFVKTGMAMFLLIGGEFTGAGLDFSTRGKTSL